MKNLPIVAHQFDYGSDIFSLFGGNVEGANTKTKGGFEIGILGGHKQNQLEEMFNLFVPSNWSIDPKQKGNGGGNDDGGGNDNGGGNDDGGGNDKCPCYTIDL
jgi:hypothetical protein